MKKAFRRLLLIFSIIISSFVAIPGSSYAADPNLTDSVQPKSVSTFNQNSITSNRSRRAPENFFLKTRNLAIKFIWFFGIMLFVILIASWIFGSTLRNGNMPTPVISFVNTIVVSSFCISLIVCFSEYTYSGKVSGFGSWFFKIWPYLIFGFILIIFVYLISNRRQRGTN